MAKKFPAIDEKHRDFIERQHVFFVASATAKERINVSPKGLDAFRIIDANNVAYLDRTGSGSETSAHLRADGRLTIMFCAFEGAPMILRLYGRGTAHRRGQRKLPPPPGRGIRRRGARRRPPDRHAHRRPGADLMRVRRAALRLSG